MYELKMRNKNFKNGTKQNKAGKREDEKKHE